MPWSAARVRTCRRGPGQHKSDMRRTSVILALIRPALIAAFVAVIVPTVPGSVALAAAPVPRMVFAHYFPPYPVSIDNVAPSSDYYTTQLLNPQGELGTHAAYGGLLRDRPIPNAPRAISTWQLENLKDEVRQAQSAKIDGFSVDILEPQANADPVAKVPSMLLQAAAAVSPKFRVMLMPDMAGPMGDLTPDQLASEMASLAKNSAAYKLKDGRLVVSPFLAEKHAPDWWSQFVSSMSTKYGVQVALVPVFVAVGTNLQDYAPISYGLSVWGTRSPAQNQLTDYGTNSPIALARLAHSLGQIWMQPVSVQDERPNQAIYDEAVNTENLRNTWQIAISTGSEWVQLATWNDYSEGTAFAPSAKHGWTYLDISSYYSAWFHTGSAPSITSNVLYLTHRTQQYAATPTFPEVSLMQPRPGTSTPQDTVEALTFLTTPGTVTTTVGTQSSSCAVPAGVGVCSVPLGTGSVSTIVTNSAGTVLATKSSPNQVTATPYVQDLQYVAAGSNR